MADGNVNIVFRASGADATAKEIASVKTATKDAEQSVAALNTRLERFKKYQSAGLMSGQDSVVLGAKARSLSAQRVGSSGASHVVSKEAQLLAQAGGKFSAGMSAGAASLNYAARIMGDSSGALAKVAANISSLGAIGAGGLSVAQSGGAVGAAGKVTLGLGAALVGYDIGAAIGNWVVGLFDDSTTDEYKEKAASARERHLRKASGEFADASFARELGGIQTSDEVSSKLKTLEDELFARSQKLMRGIDGSRENEDAVGRLEQQIQVLKKKQAELLAKENSQKEAALVASRNQDLDSGLKSRDAVAKENAWQRTFRVADADTQIAMAKARQAQAESEYNRLSVWATNASDDSSVTQEEWSNAMRALEDAFAESEKFKDVVSDLQESAKAEAAARQQELQKNAEEEAKSRQESVFAGNYQSGGNSLARVGLMASSPAVKSIEITAKNTEAIAKTARDILQKVNKAAPAVAG